MIYSMIHYAKQALGPKHPVVERLETVQLTNQFRVKGINASGRAIWMPFRHLETIIINPLFAETEGSPDLQTSAFWSLMATLLHEGSHLAYMCLDPEAGRRTAQFLREFLPKSPPQKQPLAAYENLLASDSKISMT